jgi:hypothetical protein
MRRRAILILLMAGVFFGRLNSADAENISKSPNPSENVNIAINAEGEIGAVWIEKTSSTNQQVYFSIRASGDWSSPAAIPGQSGSNANPRIAKGVSGGFVAVWHDQALNCIRFSQYLTSWSTLITVSQVGGYDFGWPAVTTTSNGRIAVAWMRGNPTFSDIYVTIFQTGWSGPVNVSNTMYGSKYNDLASGPDGKIYVVWQDDRGDDNIRTMMNNDDGNGNWNKPMEINNIQGWSFRPVLAVNSGYDMLSCYYLHQGASYYASYRLDGIWKSPMPVSDVGNHQDHDFYYSDVCPYEDDSFLFIYRDIGLNMFYAILRDGELEPKVALSNNGQSYCPSIDYNPTRGAVAAWTDRSGNSDVFVQIFDPQTGTTGDGIQPPVRPAADYRTIPLTPANVKAEPAINRNLFIVQYFWKISWALDSRWTDWNIQLAKYRIYRKLKTSTTWGWLAEADPATLFYIDKDGVSKEDRFDYKVLGVDDLTNEFYAYNRITWAANPINASRQITVQGYNIYRKLNGQPSSNYILWKTVDAAATAWEDHSVEIRQQKIYDYALTSVSDTGKESAKATAQKTYSSGAKARNH